MTGWPTAAWNVAVARVYACMHAESEGATREATEAHYRHAQGLADLQMADDVGELGPPVACTHAKMGVSGVACPHTTVAHARTSVFIATATQRNYTLSRTHASQTTAWMISHTPLPHADTDHGPG